MFFCEAQSSGLKLKRIVVTGYGVSEPAAILNGIEEAIKREYGFFLAEEKFFTSLTGETHGSFLDVNILKSRIYQKLKGVIERYEVISVDRSSDFRGYSVKLAVYVVKYVPPGISINQRRRIAVYPFEAKNITVGKQLTQAVVTYLTHSRKFSVLDRENYKYYEQEKAVITSSDADKRERAKLKHLAGTDYILIGKVNLFSIEQAQMGSKFLGLGKKGYKISYEVNYRVLMFSTGQIKYSNEQSGIIFVSDSDKRIAEKQAIDKIAKSIVDDLLFDIYPPIVIATESGFAVINIGNRLVSEGACFDVYKKGSKLLDPYTHEFLGYDEIRTGRMIIVDVKPKFSKGKVIEGYVVKGSILRPCKSIIKKEKFGRSNVKMLSNGGIVLPGDVK
jgi:hypothetical protein